VSALQRFWRSFTGLQKPLGKLLFALVIAVIVFVVLAPFVWMAISSVSTPRALAQKPPEWIPDPFMWDRYKALFSSDPSSLNLPVSPEKFRSALFTSFLVSTTTTVIAVGTGAAAAFAFVRLRIPGAKYLLIATLAVQMLPVLVLIIPLFLVMQSMGLLDTHLGLIIVYTGYLLPVVVWILVSYFESIPPDMEEAAMVDGCSRVGTLWRVVLPLSLPGLAAVCVFSFLSAWNEFFMALILTSSNAKTITVAITEFTTQAGADLGLMATGGMIGSVPPIILAIAAHRYIVSGLTTGGVKS
jgi:multiple sugar transport system permease protein